MPSSVASSASPDPTIDHHRLAPPGAGLPLPELLIARLLFRLRRARGSREAFNEQFNRERERIATLTANLSSNECAKRVLIRRLRGLEDSSRDWSVWMTLDHLRIVHDEVARVIAALAAGKTPPGAASTAAVKPSPTVNGSVVAAFERSCDELLACIAAIPDLRTRGRFAHPWFGALDASGWHALVSMHVGIHRAQIESTLRAD